MDAIIGPSADLLRALAEAEDDVQKGRLLPMQDSFDDLQASLIRKQADHYGGRKA